MRINPQTKITILPPEFVQAINGVVQSSSEAMNGNGIIINFRDKSYSPENGGYHPVEVHVDSKGNILSITDFAYFGAVPFVELGIELEHKMMSIPALHAKSKRAVDSRIVPEGVNKEKGEDFSVRAPEFSKMQ